MFNQVNALLALGLEEHIDQVLAILDQIEPKRRDTRRFITAAVPTFAQCGGAAFDRG